LLFEEDSATTSHHCSCVKADLRILLVSGHRAVAAVAVLLDMAVAEGRLQGEELHSCRLEEQSPVMPEQRRV
jgi:hypothetical protein